MMHLLLPSASRARRRSADRSPLPPARLRIALKPLIRFLASVSEDENLTQLAEVLSEAGTDDQMLVTVSTIKNGVRYRLEVQEGALQVLSKASDLSKK